VKKYCLIIALGLAYGGFAQNTIGGVKAIVPESEVKRQSAFLTAERERLLGRWDKALEAYKAFLFENPDYDAAWYGLARTYVATNDMVNAQDALGKAVEKAPDNQWYLLYQADLYEKNGRNKDALATYEILVKRFPETAEFYEKLAYLAVLTEDPKRGIKALDKVEQIRGINAENTAKKHLIYVGLGDNKKAAEEFRKLANAYPNNVRYRYELADFYERIGDKNNARKTWEEVARIDPDDAMAKIALAEQAGSDAQYLASIQPPIADPAVSIDTKIKELAPFLNKIAAGNDPALTENMLKLGSLLEKAHPEDPKAWSISGDMLYLANRNNEALEKYKRCIQLNASVFSVWDNSLNILLEQKNYAETLKLAEQAMDAFPNQPKAYIHYASAAIMTGKLDDALNQLQQAQLMTGNSPLLRAEVLELSGDAYLGKGDKNKAKDLWLKAFDISKNPALQEKINRVQ
jgi:tetratricopeptide (TPR) repeat protein